MNTIDAEDVSLSDSLTLMARGLRLAGGLFTTQEKEMIAKVSLLIAKRSRAGYTLAIGDLERTLPELETLHARLNKE